MKKIFALLCIVILTVCTAGCGKNTTGILSAGIGDTIQFGRYANDPIEWRVIGIRGNKKLLITSCGIERMKYNETRTNVTWEHCTIRKWLNGYFYDNAFSEKEKKKIELVQNFNADNSKYKTPGGRHTMDRVFLLSYREVGRLLGSNSDRKCLPTQYVINNSPQSIVQGANWWWWLRSPADVSIDAVAVECDGTLSEDGNGSVAQRGLIRPAMWVNGEK